MEHSQHFLHYPFFFHLSSPGTHNWPSVMHLQVMFVHCWVCCCFWHVFLSSFLTCDNTGNFGHEAFDSSDGYTLCLILDVGDNVFNLQRKTKRQRGEKGRQREREKKRQFDQTQSWLLSIGSKGLLHVEIVKVLIAINHHHICFNLPISALQTLMASSTSAFEDQIFCLNQRILCSARYSKLQDACEDTVEDCEGDTGYFPLNLWRPHLHKLHAFEMACLCTSECVRCAMGTWTSWKAATSKQVISSGELILL